MVIREVQKLCTGSVRRKAGSNWIEFVNEYPVGGWLSTGDSDGAFATFF